MTGVKAVGMCLSSRTDIIKR